MIFFSSLLCWTGLWIPWFEFTVSWQGPKIGSPSGSTTLEQLWPLELPQTTSQTCYSNGKCEIVSDHPWIMPPRLHTINFPFYLAFQERVQFGLSCVLLIVNLVFIFLCRLKGFYVTLAIVPIAALIFIFSSVLQVVQSMGNEENPNWGSCTNDPVTIYCPQYENCQSLTCPISGYEKVNPGGTAVWEFSRVLPANQLLLGAAFLLTALTAVDIHSKISRPKPA
jgi:hypothetical protein